MEYLIGFIHNKFVKRKEESFSKYETIIILAVFVSFNLISITHFIGILKKYSSVIIPIAAGGVLFLLFLIYAKENVFKSIDGKFDNNRSKNLFCVLYMILSVILFFAIVMSYPTKIK